LLINVALSFSFAMMKQMAYQWALDSSTIHYETKQNQTANCEGPPISPPN
jgi:hypothetical protein